MKKFTKAVAMLAVMCMLLSTVAFAEGFGSADLDSTNDQLIDVTVEGAGESEQVVLLVVKEDVEPADAGENDIMFIDQQQADTSGSVTFNDIQVRDGATVVDVWVGSANTGGAQKLGDSIDVTGVAKITVVQGTAIGLAAAGAEAQEKMGVGVAIQVNVSKEVVIDKMIWGFKVDGTQKYSSSILNPMGSSEVSGDIYFAAAFPAGFVPEGGALPEITDVSAIFLTGTTEHYTNAADANAKAN